MKTIITILVVALIAIGAYLVMPRAGQEPTGDQQATTTATSTATATSTEQPMNEKETIIGTSAGGRPITAYHYGSGDTELLFVGGIHGGYSWNTALVAFEAMDYFDANPNSIPDGVRVTVIPVLNPDGLNEVVGTAGRFDESAVPATREATIPGRFNGNDVDLNRNFDCDWKSTGVWQSRTVSGGSAAFSEPESQALRNFVGSSDPDAVVVWYSSAGGVYASSCHNGVLPETADIMKTYATAAGYSAHEEFDFYEITGDMVNWLAKEGVPAISVLLTTHDDTEWSKNRAGIEALLKSFAN